MGALTTINLAKEQAATYQPLLLAAFTFADGTIIRLSTHPLNVAEGGFQPSGISGFPHNSQDFFGRILSKDIGAVQAMSDQGIDMPPHASVTIADADKFIWINYELSKGFKGATLRLYFAFWDADTSTFSTDYITKFVGICDPATGDDETLTVSATSLTLLQKRLLPIVPIQRRCPWPFPRTAPERQDGADNEDSFFYECGYSPDASGGNARGNLVGGVPATTCNFTRENCEERGMFELDSAARITGRFGGINYDPPAGGRSREYVSGQWINIQANPNHAKYGDYYPMIYGTAWVEPPITNITGDGNSTRGEAVVCIGEVQNILKVVVNDVEVAPATDMSHSAYIVEDNLLRWNLINRGDRNGAPNADAPYNGKGDPYGSLCAILWVVHRKVAEAGSTPRLRVLVQGPKIRVYTGVGTFTNIYTDNPIWILMDVLIWTNFSYDDLDIQSFIDAAAICEQTVSYTDLTGATATRKRFTCSLVLRQRRSAAEIIRGVRENCGAMLIPNSTTGKLQCYIKRTLADQQSAPVDGSNYDTVVASKVATGGAANGYVAYRFTEASILRQGKKSTFRPYRKGVADSPNRVSFNFQDATLLYAASALAMVDSEDVSRVQQEVSAALPIEGVTSYDQGNRRARVILAENHRGNPVEDTAGTIWYEFDTTFRGVRLRVGHICLLSYAKWGITDRLFRVMRVQPSSNFKTVKIVGHWHDDDWYTDAYGTEPDPRYQGRNRDGLERPSFPWCPYREQPVVGDSMRSLTDWTFRLQPVYELAADGTSIAKLQITGKLPVNDFADLKPPLVQQQGTTATTGGNLEGGGTIYHVAICAKDAEGKLTTPSNVCRIAVTVVGSAHTVSVAIPVWDDTATGWAAFIGKSAHRLTWSAEGTGTPASVTLIDYNERAWGMPDIEFDRLFVKTKRIRHGGVWGSQVNAVGAGTLQFLAAGFTVDSFAGYDISLVAIDDNTPIPVANFRVVSNTADTLTVTPDPTDPAIGIVVNDVFVMRSKPTVASLTLTDAMWENPISNAGAGLPINSLTGLLLRFISGPGRGEVYQIDSNTVNSITVALPWITTPDATSRYIVEEPNWLPDEADSTSRTNQDPAADISMQIPVNNYLQQQLWVQVFTLDGSSNESIDNLSPGRDVYIFGSEGAVGSAGPVQIEF